MGQEHECGGTVLVGGTGEDRHYYCDRCHAFAYTYDLGDDVSVPSGIDRILNKSAFDAGDIASPEAA